MSAAATPVTVVSPPAAPTRDAARRARLRAATILLVDDEEANLDLLEALLGGDGYATLVRTTDPRDVPALVERHAPDLVLLDLHMPHRHGLDVLAELRAGTPTDEYRPVLVLTADATWEARERALACGASDFVTKPFEMTEVLLRVENLLDARTLHVAERAARARAEAAEARAALVAEWSGVLASTLDPATALAHLPRLLVPRWADGCVAVARDGGDAQPVARALVDGAAAHEPALVAAAAMVGDSAAGTSDAVIDLVVGDRPALAAPVRTEAGVAGAVLMMPRENGAGADHALIAELAARAGLAAERARLLAAAELAARERERLLAVVAHDLRNPLGAVALYAEMVTSLQPEDADRYTRDALASIHQNVVGMQRLVEDLLDVAALRGDALRIHRAEQRVGAAFDDAERMLRPLAEQRGITLRMEPATGAADARGTVDGARVVQLLSNLVGNAIKFTPRGGRVTVAYTVGTTAVQASVTDTGPGIASDELPHLFTPFRRRDRRDGRGAGLGLWIARAIVDAHDGTLRVHSRPGEGTTFHFDLPFAAAERRWED